MSQRILGRPKVKKDPVTPEMLKALAQSRTTDKSPSLSDLRSVALFRFSELCHIKACDVKFFPSYVSIFLESSKTDQFGDRAWIIIARGQIYGCSLAASSTAARAGLSVSDIIKMADWSCDDTFRRFYYKPFHDPFFCRTVLGVT